MYIEDLITQLAEHSYSLEIKDKKLAHSLATRVKKDMALTTRQGYAILAILRREMRSLSSNMGISAASLESLLAAPEWKNPLVPSVDVKPEVRHLGDHYIAFRNSGSKTFDDFRALGTFFSHGMNITKVDSVTRLNNVIEVIGKHGFSLDASTEKYLADALKFKDAPSRVIAHEDQIIFDVPNENSFAEYVIHVLGADIL